MLAIVFCICSILTPNQHMMMLAPGGVLTRKKCTPARMAPLHIRGIRLHTLPQAIHLCVFKVI